MDDQDLFALDIAALGRRFRDRSLSPVEAARAALGRAKALEGRLNAFVTLLDEAALAQARRAEAELARGVDRGPLHGVPISLKDNIDTAGVRTTASSRLWRDRVPAESAEVARRLEAAGAVVIGKCNMLEFAYGIVHPDFGQVNNPWDTGRTSGGSSGGSAASVAAGVGWGSVGTDTGGSIRIPASYCGAVGLKPTYGLVSLRGIFPLSPSLDHAGPIARSAADAALLLRAIAGHDPADPASIADALPGLGEPLAADLRGVRLGVVRQHLGPELLPGVEPAFWQAVRAMESAGALVVEVDMPELEVADSATLHMVMPEASLAHAAWLRERPGDYAPLTLAQLQAGEHVSAVAYLRAREDARRLRAAQLAALARVDALVGPTVAWEAPVEDPPVDDPAGAVEARRTAPYNLTGLPAVSVPCGLGPGGLPLGLQLAGAPLSDAALLRIASGLEALTGWAARRPPL